MVILASPTKTGSSNQSTEKLVPKKKNLVFEETYLVTKERNLVPEERKLVPKERSLVPGERKLVPKEMTRTNLVPEERNKPKQSQHNSSNCKERWRSRTPRSLLRTSSSLLS